MISARNRTRSQRTAECLLWYARIVIVHYHQGTSRHISNPSLQTVSHLPTGHLLSVQRPCVVPGVTITKPSPAPLLIATNTTFRIKQFEENVQYSGNGSEIFIFDPNKRFSFLACSAKPVHICLRHLKADRRSFKTGLSVFIP